MTHGCAIEITPDTLRVLADGSWDERPMAEGALREALRGVSASRVIVGVSRLDTVLKTIPRPESTLPEHERPLYVRLQMERQLPFPSEQAVVDFVEAPHDPPSFLAAAIRASLLERATTWCKDAGAKDPVVGLIDEGIARVLVGEGDDATIGVVARPERCEIVIARHGRLLMSRSCELSEHADDWMEQVATESRRTLMSYRVRSDSVRVSTGALACDAEHDAALRPIVGRAVELNELASMGFGAPEGCPVACARLSGLLLGGEDRLDFAAPTSPPDRHARTRQLVMLGAFLLLALIGTWITLGLRTQRALSADLDDAQIAQGEARAKAVKALRIAGRLHHARAWLDAGVDWNAHADLVTNEFPGADAMLLDRLTFASDPAWEYNNRGSRVYSADRWLSGTRVTIGVGARASDEQTVRSLREALIALDAYTLTPVGDDTPPNGEGAYPVGTAFTLSSSERSPGVGDG